MQTLHFEPICYNCKHWLGTWELRTGVCEAINENTHTDKIKIFFNKSEQESQSNQSIIVETEIFFGCQLWEQKNKIANKESLERALKHAFHRVQFESGYTHHEGELILKTVIQQNCVEYLTEIISESKKYAIIYDILSCMIHLDEKPGTLEWRIDFITKCMQHNEIYVRDPAVSLVEHWKDDELYEILSNHNESEKYIRTTIADALKERYN